MCEHTEEMRQLLADHDAHKREVDQAYTEGFTLGFQEGDTVGYGRRVAEEEALWVALADHVRRHSRTKTFDEIKKIRGEVA